MACLKAMLREFCRIAAASCGLPPETGSIAMLDIWSEAGAGTEVRLTVPAAIAYEKSGDGGKFKLFRKARIYEHRS
jgi:hypothetical protein